MEIAYCKTLKFEYGEIKHTYKQLQTGAQIQGISLESKNKQITKKKNDPGKKKVKVR